MMSCILCITIYGEFKNAREVMLKSIISRTNTEQQNKIHQDSEEGNWPEEEDKLVQIIQYGARIAIQEGLIQPEEAMQSFLLSGKKYLCPDLAKYRSIEIYIQKFYVRNG